MPLVHQKIVLFIRRFSYSFHFHFNVFAHFALMLLCNAFCHTCALLLFLLRNSAYYSIIDTREPACIYRHSIKSTSGDISFYQKYLGKNYDPFLAYYLSEIFSCSRWIVNFQKYYLLIRNQTFYILYCKYDASYFVNFTQHKKLVTLIFALFALSYVMEKNCYYGTYRSFLAIKLQACCFAPLLWFPLKSDLMIWIYFLWFSPKICKFT